MNDTTYITFEDLPTSQQIAYLTTVTTVIILVCYVVSDITHTCLSWCIAPRDRQLLHKLRCMEDTIDDISSTSYEIECTMGDVTRILRQIKQDQMRILPPPINIGPKGGRYVIINSKKTYISK